jgi:signal transduction histidine kinase
VAGLAFGATGGVLAARRPGLVVGWLLLLAGTAFGVATLARDWARHALVLRETPLPLGEAALWLGSWLWVVGYCAVVALVPLRLPDGRLPDRGLPAGVWRAVWWTAVGVTVLAPLAWALTPYDRMDRPPLEGLPPEVVSPTGSGTGPFLLALSLPLLALLGIGSLLSLGLRLRTSVGEERQQLKWVLLGAGLTLALLGAGHVVGPEGGSGVVVGLSVLPLPLGVAVAGLRYRLWDVDLVIRSTLGYAVLAALVVAVYAGGVLALGGLLGERTGAPLVATVVVALGAEPVHRRVQALVDRLVRGDRADPYRALVRLGRRLEAAAAEPVGPVALAGAAEAVRQALQLPWAVVDVVDGPRTVSGEPTDDGLRVPLVHAGEAVGALVVGPRRAGRPLSAGDLRLLDDLARHVAVAAHAVHLREALQRSRERLVTAREEERRRLRRDLHDDLGPVLAAAALQVGEVRDLTSGGPAAALAARAEDLLTGAVATVRRIVDGLRPAVLDELGLSEALHALGEGFGAAGLDVSVELRGELDGLPAAVEVAALRVATEALHNAVRHAGASRVRLGVERVDDAVEITVADDGRGLPAVPVPGVGLASMRERAEELGGTCVVVPGQGGGTSVLATLPLQDERPAAAAAR